MSFKNPRKGQNLKVMTQVSILMLKACQKVAQSPRQERRDNYAPGVLFGKGAVACGLNVCSVVTHLHPR